MNIASIDIGSNTVLLLIAKIENKKINTIVNQYKIPRISEGLKPEQPISDFKISLLLSILEDYNAEIKKYNCEKVIVTATNALRIASNSNEIIKKIKNKLNFDVKILNGTEEARLSFLGASLTLPEIKEKIVIDIGGGSTEIIFGNNKDIKFKHSFQTGVVSLTEKFLSDFPYTQNNFLQISKFLYETFYKILKQNIPPNQSTIAVAGTPTTLSAINQTLHAYDEEKIEGSTLKLNEIKPILYKMKRLSNNEIIEEFGNVVKGREDIILAGTLILTYLMETLLVDRIYVSGKGLRYGNIIDYLNLF